MKRELLARMAIFTACSTSVTSNSEIMDYKIKMTTLKDTHFTLRTLSGFSMDSALWIDGYQISYRESDIYLTIKKA